jgi:hypothetical protein
VVLDQLVGPTLSVDQSGQQGNPRTSCSGRSGSTSSSTW